MNVGKINRLCSIMLLMALTVFSISCGDDEKESVNCNQLYAEIGVATGDLLSSNCTVRIAAYQELIELYEEGKNCDELKQAVLDEGYANVDEFIAELEAALADEIAAC